MLPQHGWFSSGIKYPISDPAIREKVALVTTEIIFERNIEKATEMNCYICSGNIIGLQCFERARDRSFLQERGDSRAVLTESTLQEKRIYPIVEKSLRVSTLAEYP